MKRLALWVNLLLILTLVTACSNVNDYVQQKYPLINASGNGQNFSKVYLAEGKKVPAVAKELSQQDPPRETSKTSDSQMFLIYSNKLVNLQQDSKNPANTLVEIDSISYAQQHYSSSFLQGYLTASLLQTLLGNSWMNRAPPSTATYKGFSSSKAYSTSASEVAKPSTSDRTGTFGKSGTTGNSYSTKNDGSRKSYSLPKTSKRVGSFRRK
ncbi:MAG: hypothetical protein A2189_07745 [Paenibacillus sp. RIFOXYA1_FULL_44_5]|nr:MAG: hypothetical protein A2189_07745 [Paenibacillus sp. RIFOXYA1_FULL_44_5]